MATKIDIFRVSKPWRARSYLKSQSQKPWRQN